MIQRKHYAYSTTRCLNCKEEYNREVTDTGPQLCEQCIDMFVCCKCRRSAPSVEIIFSRDDSVWCVGCADEAASREG